MRCPRDLNIYRGEPRRSTSAAFIAPSFPEFAAKPVMRNGGNQSRAEVPPLSPEKSLPGWSDSSDRAYLQPRVPPERSAVTFRFLRENWATHPGSLGGSRRSPTRHPKLVMEASGSLQELPA
jgi:hypothetical protein